MRVNPNQSLQPYHSPVRHEEIHRERVIGSLQAENDDLRVSKVQTDGLEESLHSAQYALDKGTGDRLKLENNFKIQVDNDAIAINSLKNEGIDLKHTLADRNEEIARLRATLSNLKYTVDLKLGDANLLREDNAHLKDVASRLDGDTKVEVDVNGGLRSELDGIDARNGECSNAIVVNRDKLRALGADNDNSRIAQDNLNRDIDVVEPRIRDAAAQIHVLEGRVRGFRIDLEHIDATVGDLTGKNDAERELFERIHADLLAEQDKYAALETDHRRLVDAIETARTEIDGLRREVEELNEKVRGLTSSNADLEYQLAELKRHIEVLTRQNDQLNGELNGILDLDRKVREELERRSTLIEKQRLNEEELRKSLNIVQHTRVSSPKRA